jgi:hypothetical protein
VEAVRLSTEFEGFPIRVHADGLGALRVELPVGAAVMWGEDIVVCLMAEGITACDKGGRRNIDLARRNVLCFGKDGALKWQISPSPQIIVDERQEPAYPYTGIRIWQGKLAANNWDDWLYEVNPADGSVRRIKEVR